MKRKGEEGEQDEGKEEEAEEEGGGWGCSLSHRQLQASSEPKGETRQDTFRGEAIFNGSFPFSFTNGDVESNGQGLWGMAVHIGAIDPSPTHTHIINGLESPNTPLEIKQVVQCVFTAGVTQIFRLLFLPSPLSLPLLLPPCLFPSLGRSLLLH